MINCRWPFYNTPIINYELNLTCIEKRTVRLLAEYLNHWAIAQLIVVVL